MRLRGQYRGEGVNDSEIDRDHHPSKRGSGARQKRG